MNMTMMMTMTMTRTSTMNLEWYPRVVTKQSGHDRRK